MYLYKMLIFFVLFSGLQVLGQFSPLEVTGSGDGVNDNSTYSRLPLLDDNGDISTVVTGVNAIRNLEETEANFTDTTIFSINTTMEETTVNFLVNDTVTYSTVSQSSQTTTFTTDWKPTTDFETTEASVDSTTTSLIMTSTIETTTLTDATIEEDSTTTETTTSTSVKTTRKPIKTDFATEMPEEDFKTKAKDTAVKNPPTSLPVSTVPISEDAGKRCLFMDTGLKCDVDLICYGEGEIDCTDDEEMDADDSDFMDHMPSSLDGFDYITEGKTDPIRRIDPILQKIDMFKIFPIISPNEEASSEKNVDITTTSVPSINFTMAPNEEILDGETAEMNDTMHASNDDDILDSEVPENLSTFPSTTESEGVLKTHDNGKLPYSTDNSSQTDFYDKLDTMQQGNDETLNTTLSVMNDSDIQVPTTSNDTILYLNDVINETSTEATITNVDMTTSDILKISPVSGTEKVNEDQLVITRTKRDKNANNSNGYYISNYKVSELESSKKKLKVKSCKLTGNIVCVPRPTKSSCSGKTVCQVPPQAIETVEKPATQKGLEKWTIAVIVICAITATFTIALLVYLVFTSYKKLKVQPQNGVTTLNYVNSAQP